MLYVFVFACLLFGKYDIYLGLRSASKEGGVKQCMTDRPIYITKWSKKCDIGKGGF